MTTTTLINFPKLPEMGPEFHRGLVALGSRTGHDPSLIAMVMYAESGFDPHAVAKSTGASGLIQIMPAYAADGSHPMLKWTIAEIRAMDAVPQLEVVEEVYRRRKPMVTPRDYFLSNFFPAAVGKPLSFVMGERDNQTPVSSGGPTYDQVYKRNSGLDLDHDGRITVADIQIHTDNILARASGRPPIVVSDADEPPVTTDTVSPSTGTTAAGGVLGFFAASWLGYWLVRLFGSKKK